MQDNYFHAVFESVKGVSDRLRILSDQTSDGAELVSLIFSVKNPILKINNLSKESEISEQKGFLNLLIGLFGAIRNLVAHEYRINWIMSEQDALDIFSMISYVHIKLDLEKKFD